MNAHSSDLAGAPERLGHLLAAHNRIQQDLEKLPNELGELDYEARENGITDSILSEFDLPRDVWCDSVPGFSPRDMNLLRRMMGRWSAGRMARQEALEFLEGLNDEADIDWCYVFSGVPIKRLTPDNQDDLQERVVRFGSRGEQ